MLVSEGRGKPEYPEKNLLKQGREPTTNSTHIRCWVWHSNLGHTGGRWALSPLHHPCSSENTTSKKLYLLIFTSKIWSDSTNHFFCTAKSLHGNVLITTKLSIFTAMSLCILQLYKAVYWTFKTLSTLFWSLPQPHLIHSNYFALHAAHHVSRCKLLIWFAAIIPSRDLCCFFLDFDHTIHSVSWGNRAKSKNSATQWGLRLETRKTLRQPPFFRT